jgi:Reverse transcriptase (RNA-dependent DNA polymerase).
VDITLFLSASFVINSFYTGNTTTALVIEYAYEAMDKGQMPAILFLDLSKCFDRVSHQVLISILQEIGFEKHTLGLFSSYLTNRTQRIKIGTTLSDELVNSHYSTPQGTVLSPVLYNVYVHKMCDMKLRDDTATVYH